MRIRHYWRKHLQANAPMAVRAVACDAAGTVAMLEIHPDKEFGV